MKATRSLRNLEESPKETVPKRRSRDRHSTWQPNLPSHLVAQAAKRQSADAPDPTFSRGLLWRCDLLTGSVSTEGRYHKLPERFEHDYEVDKQVLGSGMNGSVYLAR